MPNLPLFEHPTGPQPGNTCAVTPGQRAARGVMALLVGTVALAAGRSGLAWIAVPAGAFGVLLLIGAVTGWCPTNLLRPPARGAIGADHGYPDARHLVRLAEARHAPGGDA